MPPLTVDQIEVLRRKTRKNNNDITEDHTEEDSPASSPETPPGTGVQSVFQQVAELHELSNVSAFLNGNNSLSQASWGDFGGIRFKPITHDQATSPCKQAPEEFRLEDIPELDWTDINTCQKCGTNNNDETELRSEIIELRNTVIRLAEIVTKIGTSYDLNTLTQQTTDTNIQKQMIAQNALNEVVLSRIHKLSGP